jgi:hypothetical protein
MYKYNNIKKKLYHIIFDNLMKSQNSMYINTKSSLINIIENFYKRYLKGPSYFLIMIIIPQL